MRARSPVWRLVIAVIAVVQGVAPNAAMLADARPAALAMSERSVVHFEAPGTPHAMAHDEECLACHAATELAGIAPVTRERDSTSDHARPPRGAMWAHHEGVDLALRRSRAPPV